MSKNLIQNTDYHFLITQKPLISRVFLTLPPKQETRRASRVFAQNSRTDMHSYLHPIRIFLFLLLTIAVSFGAQAQQRSFVLVIDAGHGGHDAGAVGAFSKEKDINLNVALAFGRLVESNCSDVKVVYTRRTDVFIPLQRRADIANGSKADLFISVHTNALPGGRIAYGSETYSLGMARAAANLDVAKRENSVIMLESDYKHTYEGFDPNKAESYVIFEIMQDRFMKQSVELARNIQKQYKNAGRPDKGVHQAGFLVLRNTSMPAVLTELGFITTPAEEQYLNSKQGIEELSRSIYNGFLSYRRAHDKRAVDLPANLPNRVSVAEPHLAPTPDTSDAAVAVVPVPVLPTSEILASQHHADSSSSRGVVPAPAKTERKASNGAGNASLPKSSQRSATPSPADKKAADKKAADKKAADKKAADKKAADKKTADKKAADKKAADKKTADKKAADKKEADKKTADKKAADSKAKDKEKAKAAPSKAKVTYRIQVGAGKKEIAPNDPQFKGLTIKRVKEGTMYKYFYGSFTSYTAAQSALRTVKAKMSAAYIVAYVDGKPASVADARVKEKQ